MINRVIFYNYQTRNQKDVIVEPESSASNLFHILREDDSPAFAFTFPETMKLWKVDQDGARGQTTWIVTVLVRSPRLWFSFEKPYNREGSNTRISSVVVIQISEYEEDVRDRFLGMKRSSYKVFNFMSEEREEEKKSVGDYYLEAIVDLVLPRHSYSSVVTDEGAYEFATSLYNACH